MAVYKIKKGFDLDLGGKPGAGVVDRLNTPSAIAYPLEFSNVKQRVQVNEGDHVKRGSILIEDKKNPDFKIRAPIGGTVSAIIRGDRRFIEQIVIRPAAEEQVEAFTKYTAESLSSASRDELLSQLVSTGYITFLSQRPFAITAKAGDTPKSIFVNAMNTGPHQVDANVVVDDDPAAFYAGLNVLGRLSAGPVYLCVSADAGQTLKSAQGVEVKEFTGPHPSGNTSVHIAHVDPLRKGDLIWTVKAVDVVLIGRLFLDGALPASRIISIGGSGVKAGQAKHYRVRMGADISDLLKEVASAPGVRIINGDALSGQKISLDGGLRLQQSSITLLAETRERPFLGWLNPGTNRLSYSRAFTSTWKGGPKGPRMLNTSANGGKRALVLTGLYDKVNPLNIMTDFLIRAILAGETEEAIKLGILEVAPEDFALCDFVCPCKTEVQAIIHSGIGQIMEEEGIS